MTNLFLKINKDLFKLKLNPTEILVLAQVIELDSNTGKCFISDDTLAEMFGVSASTISRTIKALEAKGLITKETRNCKGGKERIMKPCLQQIEAALTTSKLPLDGAIQASNCLLSTSKLPIVKKQNDFIKDNIIDKEKDKYMELLPNGNNSSKEHLPSGKSSCNYPIVTVRELVSNGVEYELIEDSKDLIRIKATNKIVRVV